jgi:hypothetical protein
VIWQSKGIDPSMSEIGSSMSAEHRASSDLRCPDALRSPIERYRCSDGPMFFDGEIPDCPIVDENRP